MNGWDAYERRPMTPTQPGPRRAMPCACGGTIEVPRRPTETDLQVAIGAHQESAAHRRWAARLNR